MAFSTKLWAGSKLLTKSFWDPGPIDVHQEGRSQRSAPRGGTQHSWVGILVAHPGNWAAKTREVIRYTTHFEECICQAPGHLSCLALGKAQNADPTKCVPLWSTREPEAEQFSPGKCTQPRALFKQFPCRVIWSLRRVDQESTHAMSKTQCDPDTAGTPHTCQWYLFAVFLPTPQHNWTSEPK